MQSWLGFSSPTMWTASKFWMPEASQRRKNKLPANRHAYWCLPWTLAGLRQHMKLEESKKGRDDPLVIRWLLFFLSSPEQTEKIAGFAFCRIRICEAMAWFNETGAICKAGSLGEDRNWRTDAVWGMLLIIKWTGCCCFCFMYLKNMSWIKMTVVTDSKVTSYVIIIYVPSGRTRISLDSILQILCAIWLDRIMPLICRSFLDRMKVTTVKSITEEQYWAVHSTYHMFSRKPLLCAYVHLEEWEQKTDGDAC